jgi:selenocysteine lyase/cysteine desulfurase
MLKKKYFGGGTVGAVLASENYKQFRGDFVSKFEDGTANFANIFGLKFGFDQIYKLGIRNIENHTHALSEYLVTLFRNLKHTNGML